MNEIFLARDKLNGRAGHEAGRALLSRLYRRITGENPPEIQVTDRGKPCFSHGKYHFSITHTPETVFCAIAAFPVGIDAEELTRQVKPALAHKILSPGELACYRDAADQNRALLTLWVLKEAAAKCSGEGLRGYPNHTDFRPDDPRVRELDGCLVAIITNETEVNLHVI